MNNPPSCPTAHLPEATPSEVSAPTAELANLAGNYLLFRLGDESYAASVRQLHKIMLPSARTAVPELPHHVPGMISLRGTLIPTISLRRRLGLAEGPTTKDSCILVVQLELISGWLTLLGFIVDEVEEVVSLAASDIVETPDLGPLLGLTRVKGGVTTLLDLGKVVGDDPAELFRPIPPGGESETTRPDRVSSQSHRTIP